MRSATVFVLLVIAFAAVAYAGYYPGYHRTHNGIAAVYRNDLRQVHVNNVAQHYGSGTGTARWNGVPGTGGYFGYGYHHGYGY